MYSVNVIEKSLARWLAVSVLFSQQFDQGWSPGGPAAIYHLPNKSLNPPAENISD